MYDDTTRGHSVAIAMMVAADIRHGQNISALAENAAAFWQRVAMHLTPVIGEKGMHVLYCRSLQLNSNAFPWLAAAQEQPDTDILYSRLQACMLAHAPSDVMPALQALVATFVESLSAMIGAALTERILFAAWPHSTVPGQHLGKPYPQPRQVPNPEIK